MTKTTMRMKLRVSAVAVALAILPLGAGAAGLGKLTVLSSLGQPLRAELDISANRDELSSLSARLGSPDAFKKAGVEYAPILANIQFTVDKRAGGQPYLRLTTARPLNEPFLDMLVELNWASGRLVREYTFLLDPPDLLQKPTTARQVSVTVPVTSAEDKPEAQPPVTMQKQPEIRTSVAAETVPQKKPLATTDEAKPAKKEKHQTEPATTRRVKQGDTLSKIASETKPEGVSLDQMLIALFRSNKDAFEGDNINRLKAGKIINLPDNEAVASVSKSEARKIVVAHSADFDAYRKKLATAAGAEAPQESTAKQSVSGKITPKVEDKAPAPVAGKDKLEVSKSEAPKGIKGTDGKVVPAQVKSLEEDIVARDKAIKEANSRIADLERNLNDLRKLIELKNQGMAGLQKQAEVTKPAAEAKKPDAAPAIAEKQPVKPTDTSVAAAQPVQPSQPSAQPTPPAPPIQPPQTAAPKAPLPLPPEPGFVEANPAIVFGGGGIIALLLGYMGYSAWRRKRKDVEEGTASVSLVERDAPRSSSIGAKDSERLDIVNKSIESDFSQSGMGGIDTNEGVDPVAEADVYIAYGRDTQAEEILLEALKTDSSRLAIHLKLLEIYASRKNAKQFETVARDLHAQTAGSGEDWEKAVVMGRKLDPDNPLYGKKSPEAVPVEDFSATVMISSNDNKFAESSAAPVAQPQIEEPIEATSLDFDLDIGAPQPTTPATTESVQPAEETAASLDFDFDIGGEAQQQAAVEVIDIAEPDQIVSTPPLDVTEAQPEIPASSQPAELTDSSHLIDFEFQLPETQAPATSDAETPIQLEQTEAGKDVDFGLDLGVAEPVKEQPTAIEQVSEAGEAPSLVASDFDLGEIPAALQQAPETALEDMGIPLGKLDELPDLTEETAAAAPMASAPFNVDLSSISLDLNEPLSEVKPDAATGMEIGFETEPSIELPVEPATVSEPEEPALPEVATKLELALAYEEMGDLEGARELLGEVINEGNATQRATAQAKLDKLGKR